MFRSVSRLAARRWQPKGKAKNVADSDPGAHLRPVPKVAPHEVVPTAPSVKDGRERSAIFGNYPTRQKLNYKAAKVKPDRNAAWRLDPVSVMEASPIRRCSVSQQHMRTAYMLNLRGTLVHDSHRTARVIATPDQLLHPRFAARRTSKGAWVALRRDAVAALNTRAKRSIASVTAGAPKVNDRLMEQVGAELEERVAQELELLRARIASAKPPSAAREVDACRVLRPLGSDEIEAARNGLAPDCSIAILDVRFGAKSKLSKQEREDPKVPMLRRSEDGGRCYDPADGGDVPLFPLHALLGANPRCGALVEDVLAAEREFARRCAEAAGQPVPGGTAEVEGIRAEEDASLVAVQIPELEQGRGGGVPLVVALWRVALWRGEGWDLVEAAQIAASKAGAKAGDEGGGAAEGDKER